MNKRITFGMAVVAIISIAGGYLGVAQSYNSPKLSDLQLANIDALVNDEGNVLSPCRIPASIGVSGWFVFCDWETTTEVFYPCKRIAFDYSSLVLRCTN